MNATLSGENLTLEQIVAVARDLHPANITEDTTIQERVIQAQKIVAKTTEDELPVYGITTNFGGLSHQRITTDQAKYLQENLLWGLFCGIGNPIPAECVRAGMLLRVNSLLKGASGIRMEIIERYCHLLNCNFTPVVYEHGSIGASGDLVPLAHIAGAVLGMSNDFLVNYQDKQMGAIDALTQIGLQPLKLEPKEGLALVNGTSMLTGIAALCTHGFMQLFNYALHLHALIIHTMEADLCAFAPFPHKVKPHPGQIKLAALMQNLLQGSKFAANNSHHDFQATTNNEHLIQDRYSIRCLPQFLGPIVEGVELIKQQIEIEANSANDNPLIDTETGQFYHAGNFLGEHISLGMDQLRTYIALVAKHLDAQIAMLVVPAFSLGLPASLAAPDAKIKYGLNGLQICANSIMPRLIHLSHGIATLFPTHAESYNQNINSQGYTAANLTRTAIETLQDYLAVASIFAVQAVELRTYQRKNNYNAIACLPPKLIPIYEAIYKVLEHTPSNDRPLIVNNTEQSNSIYVRKLARDLRKTKSELLKALYDNSNNE